MGRRPHIWRLLSVLLLAVLWLSARSGCLAADALPVVTVLTNTFCASSTDVGALLLHQRVGTNSPVFATNSIPLPEFPNAALTIGEAGQWHFYVFTNDTAFTNAAFLTFQPTATNTAPTNGSLRTDIDLDLYVSRDPAITNLDAAALAAADKSLTRGGTETLLYTNATPGVYYLGVKSESQQVAEYGLMAVVSDLPFAETDPVGNQLLRGVAVPALIPGGASANPGVAYVFGLCPDPLPVRRVILTNVLTHPNLSAVRATLTHDTISVGLTRQSANTALLHQAFIYDDSGEGDIPDAQPTDGPGNLRAFGGQSGFGQWQLTCLSTNQPGTNDNLWIFLERQPELANTTTALLLPGACRQEFLSLPAGITNLTVNLNRLTGAGPLALQVSPAGTDSTNGLRLLAAEPTAAFTYDATTHPPLQAGLYVLTLCNQGADAASVMLQSVLGVDPNPPAPFRFTYERPVALADNALSRSCLTVTNRDPIAAVEVGVRLNHPRLSDLA
ncbi:MAG TPA: hypothetical protein VNZ22_23065, partial [Bacillota bacterium]|nr:hypothetical protein [Bacillota bacterium]